MSKLRHRTRKFLRAGFIGFAVSFAVMLILVAVIYYNMKQNFLDDIGTYEKQLADAEMIISKYETVMGQVITVTKQLPAGHMLTQEDVVSMPYTKANIPGNAVDVENAVGKIIKIPIEPNTPIVNTMLYEEQKTPDDLRSQEFTAIVQPSKLKKGDFVDVRIRFNTGQDYIVLSKKKVQDLGLNNRVWYELNEQEILTSSSAFVDAYLHGAIVYAVPYVEPYLQENADVTYPVNTKVLSLIQSDPNIVERAKYELTDRARTGLEKDLQEVETKVSPSIRSNAENLGITGNIDSVTNDSPVQEEKNTDSDAPVNMDFEIPESSKQENSVKSGGGEAVPQDVFSSNHE